MKQYLTAFLTLHGFTAVNSSLPVFRLFLNREFSHVNAIYLLELDKGNGCSQEHYYKIKESAEEFLRKQPGMEMDIHALTLIMTDDVEYARSLCTEERNTWIMDKPSRTLIIDEGKVSDFYGMKKLFETFLDKPEEANEQIEAVMQMCREIKPEKPIIPWVTIGIVIANVIVFLISILVGDTIHQWGGQDLRIVTDYQWYRIFTSAFLHLDIYHLSNNMLMLYIAGDLVEKKFGHFRYLILYTAAIIVSGLISLLVKYLLQDPSLCIGASGAVYAVVGAVIVLIVAEWRTYGRGSVFRIFLMILCIALGIQEGFLTPGVDNVAHLSGICYGIIFAVVTLLMLRHGKGQKK